MKKNFIFIVILILIIIVGFFVVQIDIPNEEQKTILSSENNSLSGEMATSAFGKQLNTQKNNGVYREINFSDIDSKYQFIAEIPEAWKVEYIPSIDSITIYTTSSPKAALENSQIFIRNFEARDFLTLQTVDIFKQEKRTIAGRPAVEYDIEKKSGIAKFSEQPQWRSERHIVTDIRFSDQNPSIFFVFGQNPRAESAIIEHFFDSLQFISNEPNNASVFVAPMERFAERIRKKTFGMYIDPETSPVQPEVFRGYHNAVDAEVFSDEKESPVAFFAFCSGEMTQKRQVNGYGGLLVQTCKHNGETVSVLYGHVRLSSIAVDIGDTVIAGEHLGVLGSGFSAETGGERKHLHLGVYKGNPADIRGYVQSKQELDNWIDPLSLLQ